MIVASHRRSGTHFLMKSLALTFGKRIELLKTHSMVEEILSRQARVESGTSATVKLIEEYSNQPLIYIVRDPRDTLTSNYHWWQTSGESRCGGIAPGFRGVSPLAWFRGEFTLDRVPRPDPGCGVTQPHIDQGIFSDPIGFWIKHVTGYLNLDIPLLRYEDLLQNPRPMLIQFAETFRLKRPWWPRTPRKLVGHEPRHGVIGDYRNLLVPEAQELLRERAGQLMDQLGYRQ